MQKNAFYFTTIITVVQNGISEVETVLNVILLKKTFLCTIGLFRHQGFQKKWKKANKGRKGQSKATQSPVAKAYILFVFLGSLDVVYSLI